MPCLAGLGEHLQTCPPHLNCLFLLLRNATVAVFAPADNWDGSEYKGSKFNILTLLGLLFVLVPVAGLAFAYQSYGVLWG